MSLRKNDGKEWILKLTNIDVQPQEVYRMLSNSKQVTSGLNNREWWKLNVLEFGMWSVYQNESLEIIIVLTSNNELSELDLRVRLKRICGIQCDIHFGIENVSIPQNIIEFKHYKSQGGSRNPLEVTKYVNEKYEVLCPEI
jgi:hypothetical protein